jgi:hypothetical protein
MKRHEWDYIKRLGGAGILRRSDIKDLEHARAKVLWLMLDGNWHTATEIINHSETREGLRRLRELRNIPGAIVERDRFFIWPGNSREFKYRLSFERNPQRGIF